MNACETVKAYRSTFSVHIMQTEDIKELHFLVIHSESIKHIIHGPYVLVLFEIFRTWVADPVFINGEQTITLRQAGTVVDLADTRLSTTFLKTQPSCTSMGNDVASDGLLGIRVEHRTWSTIDLSNDLVGNDHCDSELICQPLKGSHEFRQMRLSGRQLPSSNKIRSVQRCRTINNKKREPRLTHHRRGLVEKLELMVGIVGTRICNIIEHFLSR